MTLIVVVTAITVFAISLFIFHYFSNAVTDGLRTSDFNDSAGARTSLNFVETGTGLLDTFMVILIFGGLVGIVIYSFLVPSHPVFVIPFIIMLLMAILISIPLSNAYEKLYEAPKFVDTAAAFSMTSHFMAYLPLYTLIAGAIGIVILFSKRESVGGGAGVQWKNYLA